MIVAIDDDDDDVAVIDIPDAIQHCIHDLDSLTWLLMHFWEP